MAEGLFSDPNTLVRQLQEQSKQDIYGMFAQMNPLQIIAAGGAYSGSLIGQALEQLGGYEDPRIARARTVYSTGQEIINSGINPEEDPVGFSSALGKSLIQKGLLEEGYRVIQNAQEMYMDVAKQQLDTEKLAQERELKEKEFATRLEAANIGANAKITAANISAAKGGGGSSKTKITDAIRKTIRENLQSQISKSKGTGWGPFSNRAEVEDFVAKAEMRALSRYSDTGDIEESIKEGLATVGERPVEQTPTTNKYEGFKVIK